MPSIEPLKHRERSTGKSIIPTYGGRWNMEAPPRHYLSEDGMRPDVAFRMVSYEMYLEGSPALNLATCVTTWMEPEADELIREGTIKNQIDGDEYPRLKVIEDRIIRMEASLFNAPDRCEPTGASTIGSSEAIMLGLLAHKWSWRKKMKFQGKDSSRPNVIFGADAHICWEKFARYFDVEMRVIPMQTGKYTINADDIAPLIDVNTIAVGCVVGTTFTGQVDDVQGINQLLLDIKQQSGNDIPIHIDAATGGFVMPFVAPEFEWDFRLEQVRSINVSNHKFGLVYAGMGSLIFRDKSDLPDELPFEVNYLGGAMNNYSLNFSKSSSILLAQYYMFIRLGKRGYRDIINAAMTNARYLQQRLLDTGHFELLTESNYLPVVVVKLKDDARFSAHDISDNLRKTGWIVPAYSLPPNAEETVVLRMVVKENFSHDLAEKLVFDLLNVIKQLESAPPANPYADFRGSAVLKSHGVC